MKRMKLLLAMLLICVTAVLTTGCGVKKEKTDVILESWSEDTEAIVSGDSEIVAGDTEE